MSTTSWCAERDAIDTHLVTCAVCRWFVDRAARVTRLARTAVATQEPDVTLELLVTIDGRATVLQALTDLDRVSTTCATAMMALNGVDMVSATRAALDCADIAAAAQRVLSTTMRYSAPAGRPVHPTITAATGGLQRGRHRRSQPDNADTGTTDCAPAR